MKRGKKKCGLWGVGNFPQKLLQKVSNSKRYLQQSIYSFVWNTKKCLQLFETFWSNFCGKFPTPQSPHFFSRFDKKIPKLPWLDGISELVVRKLNPCQDQTATNRLISTSFDRSIINITHLHTMLSRLYLALLHSQHVNNNIGNKISDRCPKWKKSTGLQLIKVRTF